MPITRGNSDRDFDAFIDQTTARVEVEVVKVFCKIGAYGYNLAFSSGSYQDQTGCTRSSIGWGVTKDGRLVASGGFKQVLAGGEGVQLGKKRLQELAAEQSSGISLIIVVGENHAIYLEAMGYDVLTFSELQCVKAAENLIDAILK